MKILKNNKCVVTSKIKIKFKTKLRIGTCLENYSAFHLKISNFLVKNIKRIETTK